MTRDEAVAFFGSQLKLAKRLGITQGSVSLWAGGIPPLRQLQIERLTKGKLRADRSCDSYRVAPVQRKQRAAA